MTAATRTQAMLAARAQASRDKRQQVLTAVQALEAAGTPVTPAAVAAAAQVSIWLVYASGVREHVEAAQRRQGEHPPGPGPVTAPHRGVPATQPACAPISPSPGTRSAGSAPNVVRSSAGSASSSAPKSKDPARPS